VHKGELGKASKPSTVE